MTDRQAQTEKEKESKRDRHRDERKARRGRDAVVFEALKVSARIFYRPINYGRFLFNAKEQGAHV